MQNSGSFLGFLRTLLPIFVDAVTIVIRVKNVTDVMCATHGDLPLIKGFGL
jgi:hypothetical protein